MSKKKIYLSGAMGCYVGTEEENYPKKWRKEVEDLFNLSGNKFTVFNPIRFYNYDSGCNEKEVMNYELRQLKNSDILLVNLKDIDSSVGTIQEILYAYILGIPIIAFLPSDTKETFIHPWIHEQIDKCFYGEDLMESAVYYIVDYYGE